jgi:hypothetical protein
MDESATPAMTVEELDQYCQALINTIQADIDSYDERVAIQAAEDNKTTTERATEALQRPERFRGEHDVARAWLRHYDPKRRVFWGANE